MKYIKTFLVVFLCIFLLPINVRAKENVEVHLFYSESCTFCKHEIALDRKSVV